MFMHVDRDKTGRIGFFGSSGGTSGFCLQIGTVPTRSGRLASMGETEKNRHTRDKQITYIVAKNSMKTGKTDGRAERERPRGRRKQAVGSKPVVGRHL